jgi:acetolactate synthase I/II/III large subunit
MPEPLNPEPMNTAGLLAHAIDQVGVSSLFGYPGDPTIELMEQSRRRDIDVVLARREGTAALMAEGYAMATGKLGVAFSTLGPGSSSLVSGVASAQLDRVPVLAISGQIDSAQEPYFTHQVINHGLLFSPVSKWAGRLEAGSAGVILRKALRLATAERPGAVHLTANADTLTKEVDAGEFSLPPLGATSATIDVHRSEGGADPVAVIARSRRPVILAGVAAVRGRATDSLVRFAESLGAPVIVGPMAKGVFPEDHELFGGVMDVACTKVVREFVDSGDLVISVGFDAVELVKPWSSKLPVLHIDSTPNLDQIYASDCEVVGDIATILAWLTAEQSGGPGWSGGEVPAYRARLRGAFYAGRVSGALNPTDVVDIVRASVPEDAIVTTDVGSHKFLVAQGWRTTVQRAFLCTNGLSAMGFGVPSSIAAAIAMPGRQVVAMVGDGGFAMAATELRLASRLGLPIVVVVFADGSLNRIELKQMALGYPSTGTRIEDMDLVDLASGLVCDGVRVTSPGELTKALTDLGGLSRPLIVEARIDPSQYLSQF